VRSIEEEKHSSKDKGKQQESLLIFAEIWGGEKRSGRVLGGKKKWIETGFWKMKKAGPTSEKSLY